MSIVVKKYRDLLLESADVKNLWNDFARNAKNSHFFFQRDYMDYHQDRFEDYSLMVYTRKMN